VNSVSGHFGQKLTAKTSAPGVQGYSLSGTKSVVNKYHNSSFFTVTTTVCGSSSIESESWVREVLESYSHVSVMPVILSK